MPDTEPKERTVDEEAWYCWNCGYVGLDLTNETCQSCHEKFPPPNSAGETVPCECGSMVYDQACPECDSIYEFGMTLPYHIEAPK